MASPMEPVPGSCQSLDLCWAACWAQGFTTSASAVSFVRSSTCRKLSGNLGGTACANMPHVSFVPPAYWLSTSNTEAPRQGTGQRKGSGDCERSLKITGPVHDVSGQSRTEDSGKICKAVLHAAPPAGRVRTSQRLRECEGSRTPHSRSETCSHKP